MDRVRAPELPDQLDWVNCNIPPAIASSKGKVILLYFWTYSNINSLNLLPDLRTIENRHDDGLIMIGVNCPKFSHEQDPANVLKAINRLFLRYPVCSDPDFKVWQSYGIEAWPSVAVIDAEGYLTRILSGDDMIRQLDNLVGELLDQAAVKDLRNFTRVQASSRKPEPTSVLKFPTAIATARDFLYVCDSANNRVLEIRENGQIMRVFGSGNPGFWDGVLENSGFSLPRGLVVSENYIYVADTGNHAIRRINLFNGEVETLIGTGKPGKMMVRDSRELREVTLVSPVALVLHGTVLYISNAGMHQIWKLDLEANTVGWFTGTGQAIMTDGNPIEAGFMQPMGMTVCKPFLYVADADASAVREVHLEHGGVITRIGAGGYCFGDQDGARAKALMQYPMDLAVDSKGKQIWIADSFNNKLRVYNIKGGNLQTPEIDYEFSEPFGLHMDDKNVLWVANTNAHEIVKVDVLTKQCHTFEITEARH